MNFGGIEFVSAFCYASGRNGLRTCICCTQSSVVNLQPFANLVPGPWVQNLFIYYSVRYPHAPSIPGVPTDNCLCDVINSHTTLKNVRRDRGHVIVE